MKKNLLLMLAVTLFTCCSKDGDIDASGDELGESKYPNSLTALGEVDGVDGVGTWKKENEISFTDHYSIIDTVIQERVIIRDVTYVCNENEKVHVKWAVNGVAQNNTKESRRWDGEKQKWIVTNTAQLNVKGFAQNIKIEATVIYPDRSVRRSKTIPTVKEEKNISDIFGFTFGMQRQSMGQYISHDISPKIAYAQDGYHRNITCFGFLGGILKTLYRIESTGYPRIDSFNALCKKCKIPTPLVFSNSYNIENPQEWTYKQLRFKVYNTSIKELYGISSSNEIIICLSIEKIQ